MYPDSAKEFPSYDFSISQESLQKMEKGMYEIIFRNREYMSSHNPHDQEKREMRAVRTGNLQDLQASWQETYNGKIGILADTPVRQAKNHAIVLVTLSSRAAMESGVLPETGYSLSDIYIQQIEKAASAESAFFLGRQAEYHYTCLVRRAQENTAEQGPETARLNNVKHYIFTHLHEKLPVKTLAEQAGLNPTYFCEWFRKETGTTIGAYIEKQKIEAVCNLLIYSDVSLSTLASCFAYSSQSHLGKRFRQVTGMTLRQYRMKYQKLNNS